MINLDALGLSPTKVWTAHSDKDLVHSLIVMVYALKLSASQIDIAAAGTTDSDPFAAHHIPQITIHSLTQQNVATGATTNSVLKIIMTHIACCADIWHIWTKA